MQIIYTGQPITAQRNNIRIFLAGPSPRSIKSISWRPQCQEFIQLYFDKCKLLHPKHPLKGCTVYSPEYKPNKDTDPYSMPFDYLNQTEWEYSALHNSDIIIFWVARELIQFPGFTTNVEFGYYLSKYPEKVFYGRPENSPNNRYLDWLYTKESKRPVFSDLPQLIDYALPKYFGLS